MWRQGCRAYRALAVIFIASIFVSACGGGGGDDGGGDQNSGGRLSFTLDRNSISFDVTEGESTPSQFVTATASGTYSGTLYVAALVEGTAIDPNIPATISGVQGTFGIAPRVNLAPGNYSGRVLLLACADAQCNTRIGGTPLPVSYTVNVRAALKVTPRSATLTAEGGSEASQSFSVQLPQGASSFTAVLTAGDRYFRIVDSTPNGFRIIARSLPSGTYMGAIRISAGAATALIDMTYNVTPPAGGERNLAVKPANLALSTVEGATTAPVSLSVNPATWDPAYEARIEYGNGASNWLTLARTSDGYEVVGDATALSNGAYSATITVSGQFPVAPVQIPVALTVGIGLVRPADIIKTITAESTAADLQASVPVSVAGGPPVGWTATSNASWLKLTRAAGQTGTPLNLAIDASLLAALANDEVYSATVTVTPDRATMASQSFSVQVTKVLAQVTGLGPYLHVSDRPLKVIVRGIGFDAVANVASRLRIENTSNLVVERVNDTELVVKGPALAAGSYRVSISNVLGEITAFKTIKVVDPRSNVYFATRTGGNIASLVYDAERRAAYLTNTGLSSLQRLRQTGSSWALDSIPVVSIYDAGLTNDGSALIVGNFPGTLRLLNPESPSFEEVGRFEYAAGLAPGSPITMGIPVTNDGRVWVGMRDRGSAFDFGYLDPRAATFTKVTPSFLNGIIGPGFALARDGERLLINQNSCCTPRYPFLYLDAAQSVLLENPSGRDLFYDVHASDDGDRVVYDFFTVLNRNFELIGNVQLPASHFGWFGVAALVSPEGSRTYVLAYNDSEIHDNPPAVPGVKPRVYVFDSSTRQDSQSQLPLLGYFEIDDYPTCRAAHDCNYRPRYAMSPDGRTLFFAGSERFVVVPVPAENTLMSGSAVTVSGRGGLATKAWRLQLADGR